MSEFKDDPDSTELSLGCLIVLIGIIVGTFLRGWALCKLWTWFIVPLGAPTLSMWWALGISTTVNLFHPQRIETDYENKLWRKVVSQSFVINLGHPLMAVLMGWLIYSIMDK
jgi:uncharacterized membrane protein YesL